MSRSERLLDLLQRLRAHRHAVNGAVLAGELGISLRTLYRDIASLQAQGARIDGSPGLGYLLRPGFTLPPLMFSDEEVEALALGTRWVADRADGPLAEAARQALAKIAAVLPPERRQVLEQSALIVGPADAARMAAAPSAGEAGLATIRRAIRAERKLDLRYVDGQGTTSERTVWPFAIGFFDRARVLVAWCELRRAIRHFRIDRITGLSARDEPYPERRHALMAAWREAEGVRAPPA